MLFEPRGVPRALLSLSDLNSGIIVPAVTGLLRRLEMEAGFGHNASSVERGPSPSQSLRRVSGSDGPPFGQDHRQILNRKGLYVYYLLQMSYLELLLTARNQHHRGEAAIGYSCSSRAVYRDNRFSKIMGSHRSLEEPMGIMIPTYQA